MTVRLFSAASVVALLSACSQQPGPSSLNPFDLGNQAYEAGDFLTAEQAYLEALVRNPRDTKAMLGLAQVYENTGRALDAKVLFGHVDKAQVASVVVPEPVQNHTVRAKMPSFEALNRRAEIVPVSQVATDLRGADPVYGLDADGYVYEIGGTAVVADQEPVFQSYDVLPARSSRVETRTAYAVPVRQEYSTVSPIRDVSPSVPSAGMIDLGPYDQIDFAAFFGTPKPQVVSASIPVLPIDSVSSYNAPYSAPLGAVTPAAPVSALPRYTPAPVSAAAPRYFRQPVQSTAASYRSFPSPAPVSRVSAAPVPVAVRPVLAPAPLSRPQVSPTPTPIPVTRSQPGYTVIDGNFVYVSAEDIANGAIAPTAAPAAPAAEGYGVPVPVAASAIPVDTPESYSAPRGVTVVDGIPMIELR